MMRVTLNYWGVGLVLASFTCCFPGATQEKIRNFDVRDSESKIEGSNPFENTDTILFILDCSKSMAQSTVVGHSKSTQFDRAKLAVRDLLSKLPKNMRCGLRVFGNTPLVRGFVTDCSDSKLRVPIKAAKSELLEELESLQPVGTSCMFSALVKGETDLVAENRSLIVLITSEKDECGASVNGFTNSINVHAETLRKIVIYSTASHALAEGKLQDTRLIARATKGRYYDVSSLDVLLSDAQNAASRSTYH